MDFQKIVDCIKPMTCIISVEKFPDGTYGNIRIVTGNKAYVDSIEHPGNVSGIRTNKFIANREYQTYFPKNEIFEDFCYRCAILKQPLHNYVHTERVDHLFHVFLLPLEAAGAKNSGEENIGYCLYSRQLSQETKMDMLSNLSYETAADVLKTCIKLRGTNDFRKSMDEVLDDIRVICQARHCCVLLMDVNNRKCSILSEAYAGSAERRSMSHWEDDEHYELVQTWEKLIGEGSCLIVRNQSDMEIIKEGSPKWYASLAGARVDGLVLFPLKAGGELLGYIWATNFDVENTVRIKETLELTTFFIASEIASYQMVDRLTILSSMDMLTGVYNRNAMNNRVDQLCKGNAGEVKSIGIVFADLNGLKNVNDTEGHAAGDLLLKNAAMLLQNVFVGNEIYRAGGDEFMVMMEDAPLEELERRVELVRQQTEGYRNVSFAVGFCHEADSRNVREAMKAADERMYEDKMRYYERFPKLRRD